MNLVWQRWMICNDSITTEQWELGQVPMTYDWPKNLEDKASVY